MLRSQTTRGLTWRTKERDREHKPLSLVVLKIARDGTWCMIAPTAALQREGYRYRYDERAGS